MSLRRTLAVVGLVYFVEGFPMGVFGDVWPVYFRGQGMDLETIGWISVLGLAWSAKALWSPLVDRFFERQHWVAGSLVAMAAAQLGLAVRGAEADAGLWLLLSVFCLASATQDVAIDAYTVGLTPEGQEGPVNAARVTAYRIALIASGSGLLLVPRWAGWSGAFTLGAVVSLGLAVAVLRTPRVVLPARSRGDTLPALKRWLAHPGAPAVLAFVMLYRVCDLAMAPMVKPFWVDRAYSNEEIGLVNALGSLATLVGAAAGGAFVSRYGIARGLLWLGLSALGSNLGYALAAAFPQSGSPGMYAAALTEAFCSGLAVTAFLSFCMRITEREHAAVQYALLSALFVLPGRLLGGQSGAVTEHLGYAAWFALTALASLPAFAFLPWARARLERVRGPEPA